MKKFWLIVIPAVLLVGVVWQTLRVRQERRVESDRRTALIGRLDAYLGRRMAERVEFAEDQRGRHGIEVNLKDLVSRDDSWAEGIKLLLETAPTGTITPSEWSTIETRLSRLEQPQKGESLTVGAEGH